MFQAQSCQTVEMETFHLKIVQILGRRILPWKQTTLKMLTTKVQSKYLTSNISGMITSINKQRNLDSLLELFQCGLILSVLRFKDIILINNLILLVIILLIVIIISTQV